MLDFLKNYKNTLPIHVLDASIPFSKYCPIDLSVENSELNAIKVSNPKECQSYINKILARNNATVAYGGYLENRKLYEESELFSGNARRNIHLGMDFWCEAGTKVITPLDARVHSFNNNEAVGDYGPTILLEHKFEDSSFFTLYGHLSIESLEGLFEGREFKAGEPLATLGVTEINVNYAPHLHFQLIMDLQGRTGDYPGVCGEGDLTFFKQNCPNPNLLLKIPFNDR